MRVLLYNEALVKSSEILIPKPHALSQGALNRIDSICNIFFIMMVFSNKSNSVKDKGQ